MNYLGETTSEKLSNVRSDIDPDTDNVYDIGSNKRFRSGNFVNLLCNTINADVIHPKIRGDLDIGIVNADVIRLGGDGVYIDNGNISASGFIKAGGLSTQFMMADGTVSSSQGDNDRILALETNCAELNDKTLNIEAVPGTSTFTYKIVCPQIDAPSSEQLSIGLVDASLIEIARQGIVTYINGTSCNIATRLNTPLLDRASVGQLSIGSSSNTSTIEIGNTSAITTILGTTANVTGRLCVGSLDRVSAGTLNIGILSTLTTALMLGNTSIVTTIQGTNTNIVNRLNVPVIDTVSGVAMTIGTATQTGLTIGRPQTTTSIRGSPLTSDSAIINFSTCIPTIASNSKLICSRYVMAAAPGVTNTGSQTLSSPGYGNLSWNLGDNFTTFITGTTLRISGLGYLTSMAAGSTLGLVLNYGTTSNLSQQLFTVTFVNATLQGVLNFDINIQILATGSSATHPFINGIITHSDGNATISKPILITLWSTPVNLIAVNLLTFVTSVSGSVSYGINSFMVDNIR